jgi:hypothetical protein
MRNAKLMEDGAEEAFFQGHRSGLMLPHRIAVLTEAEPGLALSVTQDDLVTRQRRQWGFDLDDALPRVIPAALSRSGHASIVGIDAIRLPPSLVHIIVGFFQGECSGVPFDVVLGHHPIEGISGGVDTGRLQGC